MRIPDSNLNRMYQEHPDLWLNEVLNSKNLSRIEEVALLGAAKPWNIMGTSLMATYMSFRLLDRTKIVPSEAAAISLFQECRSSYSMNSFSGVVDYVEKKLTSMICGVPLEISLTDTVMMTADILLTGFLAGKVDENEYPDVLREALNFTSRPEFQKFLIGKTGSLAVWQGKRFLGSMIMGWGNWQKVVVEIVCNHAFGELPASFFVEPTRKMLNSVLSFYEGAQVEDSFFNVVTSLEEKIGPEYVSYQDVQNMMGVLSWAAENGTLDPTCDVGASDEALVFWGTALVASIIEDIHMQQKLLPEVVVSYIEAAQPFSQ